MNEKAREIEVEVVPEGEPRKSAHGVDDPFIALIARLMDTLFAIPGTKIRFGLDPIIGLLPLGLGASASAFVSLILIARSAQYGVPRAVLARMAMNVVINSILDAVPVVGDALSVFYRSNARNYELLRQHAGSRTRSTRRDWLFVSALLGGIFLVLLLLIVGAWTILTKLWHAVF